jgi:hypothetical protein
MLSFFFVTRALTQFLVNVCITIRSPRSTKTSQKIGPAGCVSECPSGRIVANHVQIKTSVKKIVPASPELIWQCRPRRNSSSVVNGVFRRDAVPHLRHQAGGSLRRAELFQEVTGIESRAGRPGSQIHKRFQFRAFRRIVRRRNQRLRSEKRLFGRVPTRFTVQLWMCQQPARLFPCKASVVRPFCRSFVQALEVRERGLDTLLNYGA